MSEMTFCRIGVFYDGSYFAYAQEFFYHRRKLGWIHFQPLHALIENTVCPHEQAYRSHKIVYAAWFQGLFPSTESEVHQLRRDRNLYHDLMHAGIEPKYFPMSASHGEKGADVALAIDALQMGIDGRIDVAVLVTGDADLVPLVHALLKQGVRVMAVYFEYKEGEYKGFINERLLRVCNYALNVNHLEADKNSKATFKGLFRKAEEGGVESSGYPVYFGPELDVVSQISRVDCGRRSEYREQQHRYEWCTQPFWARDPRDN